jgi:hypothetical protein
MSNGNSEQKINVNSGGTVTIGEKFKWQNTGPGKVKVTECSAFLTASEYGVDPPGNGKGGTKDAQVRSDIQAGDYVYEANDEITGSTPTMKVNSSTPKY